MTAPIIVPESNPIAIQVDQGPAGPANVVLKSRAPTSTDDNTQGYAVGQPWLDTVTNALYVATSVVTNAATWAETAGGGGAVTSVFGRTGAVTAEADDYSFSEIGSPPTTLEGYGITDDLNTAARLTGGGALSSGLTLDLADINPPAGTVGSSTEIPVLTIDEYGRVTSASEVAAAAGGYDLATTTVATGSSVTLTSATNVLKILTGVSFPFTVNLPAGSGVESPLYIVDQDGQCSLANVVQVAPHGSDTIRGSSSDLTVITMPNGQAVLTSNQASPTDWTAWTSTRGQTVFAAPGTYVIEIPPDVTWVDMEGCGPGGAGGSGGFGVSDTACTGGGSGAGGNYARQRYPAADLPTSLTVVIPATPSGGAAVTSHSNGNPGSAAANAYVWDGSTYYYLVCQGGGPGGAGQDTATAGSAGSQEGTWGGSIWQGAAGVASSSSGGAGSGDSALSLANGAMGANSGGSGGGVNSSGTAAAGGQGNPVGTQFPPSGGNSTTPGQGGAAGTVGAGQSGGNGVALKGAPVRGAAGGGGGAGNASAAAGPGGAGAFPGGGGGGGGATLATSSGAGGSGGGACIAIAMG